jgi:hypothetical protein
MHRGSQGLYNLDLDARDSVCALGPNLRRASYNFERRSELDLE